MLNVLPPYSLSESFQVAERQLVANEEQLASLF
jgi:hypothetical protein